MARALSATPAAAWPSFQRRPSTARTRLFPSLATTQLPTTAAKEFGSAPTVSCEKLKTLPSVARVIFGPRANAAPAPLSSPRRDHAGGQVMDIMEVLPCVGAKRAPPRGA